MRCVRVAVVVSFFMSMCIPVTESRGDAYSDAVLATGGIVSYYRMNENPAEIGDSLINSVSPGTLDGIWGFEDNNPDTLPTSGEPGPASGSGFGGLDDGNFSAYFGGSAADDNEDGDTSDNVADQMDLGGTEDFDNEFATISLFMKASVDGNDSRVFTTESGAAFPFRLIYGSVPDYSSMVVVTGGDFGGEFAQQTTGAVFNDDQWHHLVVVRDGDDAQQSRFYYDGTNITDDLVDPGDSHGATGPTARIGARHGGDNFGWGGYEGHLDEFAYWNRALTDEEALALYAAATGPAGILGDFNNNGMLDSPDIDDLTMQSASGLNDANYDLNADTLVNRDDVKFWISDLFGSWVGDANLDLEFNSTDLTVMLASGTYESGGASVWSQGDFNGDGVTDSSDLTFGLAEGGYELGPPVAVPEPTGISLLLVGLFLFRRRQRSGSR